LHAARARGIGCWLALRDLEEGVDPAAAILEAIRTSELVLLLFSASANASTTVLRDIERAVAYERPVLSVRTDDATPNASLQHYLNLAAKPVAIPSLETVKEPELGLQPEAARRRKLGSRTWGIALGAALVALLALGLGLGLGLTRTGHQATWIELRPLGTMPPARGASAMVDAASIRKVILFGGGSTPAGSLNDTWAYDPATNIWTELKPSGTLPGRRFGHSMAYNPATRRLIMFGGTYFSGDSPENLNDTWGLRPHRRLLERPQPRRRRSRSRRLRGDGLRPLHQEGDHVRRRGRRVAG
jgi:hypothetical protein